MLYIYYKMREALAQGGEGDKRTEREGKESQGRRTGEDGKGGWSKLPTHGNCTIFTMLYS